MANQTPLERRKARIDAKVVERLHETTWAFFLEPRVPSYYTPTYIGTETTLRGTMCLVAMRRWQLDHDGALPDLQTVFQAAGISKVPTDPYSGRPMLMTTVDGQPVIYSVGQSGKDNRAVVERIVRTKNPRYNLNLLFRLPAVQ